MLVTSELSMESIVSSTSAMSKDVQRAKAKARDTAAMTSSLSTCGRSMVIWGIRRADRVVPLVGKPVHHGYDRRKGSLGERD